ncbi:uncharacterized protein LOC113058643 [Carassius auratus]|uniref:Uncharacterized protein LOC113058643 n=1 Tax=Carassius auratus TaxID=7957 RepID=A0A6P6LG98_CARAU|nr:uncharacterized protein LOC113058643 [Carassius auratus]
MADEKPDLESLKRKRSNAQRIFTTRINRLNVSAGRLREAELSEELVKLKDDYDKLLDGSNEYVDALSQIDATGDDSESQDALARRDASEQKFLETESKIMEMLWTKYAEPDIDALVKQFKSAFNRAEALGTSKVPWAQQRVESGKLERKLHELRDAVYTWRDYRPYGRDKWMLFLSLREDKEQLMDGWTYRREDEVMKRDSTELKGHGEEAEDEDEGGNDVVGGHVITDINSLTTADSITLTQPVALAIATPPVNSQPAVVSPPAEGQETVYVTSSPSFMSTDRASISTCAARGSTAISQPQSRYGTATEHNASQQMLQPILQSRRSDSGLGVSFTLPSTFASTPQWLNDHATLPVDLSMGQSSSMPYSNPGSHAGAENSSQWARPRIKLTPISLPKFSGDRRSYWRWKAEWESIQAQAEPTGSRECKKLHLLDSISESVKSELRLYRCRDANDIFRELENHYGDKAHTAEEIVLELQSRPAVKNHQPRETLELILAVERAVLDLSDLGCEDAVRNQLVIRSLESKLPDVMKREWLMCVRNPVNDVHPGNRFDRLLMFLEDQKSLLVRLEQLLPSKPWPANAPERPSHREKPGDRWREKKSFTKTTVSEVKRESKQLPCAVCGDGDHGGKLFRCKTFRKANLSEKKAQVKKVKACTKCLDVHGVESDCTPKFLCRKDECKKGDTPADHHYFLCPKASTKKDTVKRENKEEEKRRARGPTEEQEAVFGELGLTPHQLEAVRRACTNKVTSTVCPGKSLMQQSGLKEHPVLMMLVHVTTKRGDSLGALVDLASDTNYITHQAAERLGLNGEPVSLVVYGVGTMKVRVDTKRYLVKIKVWTSRGTLKLHEMICYGMEDIAKVDRVVKSERLKQFFPEVEPGELARPKKIDLLISTREGRLAPQRLQRVGDLVLWDGPLGKIVSGVHPDLFEDVEVAAWRSKTHFAHSMRTVAVKVEEHLVARPGSHLEQGNIAEVRTTAVCNKEVFEWLKWDSIGAACDPICGGCRCGKCSPGGKEMSLADEKELEIIKAGLTFREGDAHSDQPHWDAKYPWMENPVSLPNNRKAVEATFLRTEKRLMRDPLWKEAYTKQVHEMVERGAAIKLTKDVMDSWKGAVWWVSHLTAPNPHSVTTPVRLVWNSSQEFGGVSMNSILLKGPDVLNPIRAVLLRFRVGEHAAIGDITKMYNSVWLEEQEVHVHRFLWRDSPEDEIEDYAVVRVNMGDKPAGCIAQVAMRETAKLPQFSEMKEERRVIEEDSYVDDLLTSHNDPHRLNKIQEGVEKILRTGGFYLKPWIRCGQSGRREETKSRTMTLTLPNQLREEDNKALGVGYLVQEDKLFVMVSINFSSRKKKMRTEIDLTEGEVEVKTPNPLTRRVLLSQIAGLYDPIGLVTPVKQKGVILVRRAFQEAGKLTKDTWDEPLSDELRGKAIDLFKEYARLSSIKFYRSLTPSGWKDRPWGITFSDGSCESYGAVLYLRWETSNGVVTRLVESKAKLTPLNQKGDAVMAEVCGAVFATRLKGYMLKHGRLDVEKWYHFIDSQTVLGAIQRESYGFQTFFANRIGEIQKAGPVTDWWWIPGKVNVADLVTRGCAPDLLGENSVWQKGPEFLSDPVEDWPIKSASEVAVDAREVVSKLQRKAFSAVLTRVQAKKLLHLGSLGGEDPIVTDGESGASLSSEKGKKVTLTETKEEETLWGAALIDQVDPTRCSSLTRLCGIVGYIRRAVRKWLARVRRASKPAKWEAVLTVKEREVAFQDLCLAAQNGVMFPVTTLNRLVVSRDGASGLLRCHGRVQDLTQGEIGVPLVPYKAWISALLTREAHEANHEGVAGTHLRVRSKAWVIRGSRIARNVVDSCMHCRKIKAKMCKQVMGELPLERTKPAAPFEFTTLDLFGPYVVKDTVKRRTEMKIWGVVFSCMASRAVHADIVEDLSTEGFLKTYQRFTALRGHPRKLWSDQGTNFMGAKPVLQELYEFLSNIDKDQVQRKAVVEGTDWTWVFHPADSPHRNGAAEAAVRVLKRALSSVGKGCNLTALEFQTLLYLAANLSNERPIGARAQVQDETVEVITPNSLLLGRAGPSGDSRGFEYPTYPVVRLRTIQIEVNKFWKRWSQLAGPNLYIRQKWHAPARNVAAGDLVWLADQNALRGQFRLGRVVEVCPDARGVVRDVRVATCRSCPVSGGQSKRNRVEDNYPSTILHRDVRRLVVLLPVEEQ